MQWDKFDFKLLIVFDAVMRERHVTRAGERLGLSQPAISHALQRLRHAMRDELFVRTPEGMHPTPKAEALAGPVRSALSELERAFEPEVFDPQADARSFDIALNNYAAFVMAGPIAKAVHDAGSRIKLHMRPSGTLRLDDMLDRGDLDFAIVGDGRVFGERFGTKTLVKDTFAVVMRRGHPASEAAMDYQILSALPHLVISSTGEDVDFVDELLQEHGLPPRVIQMSAPFLSATPILANSDMIAVLSRRVAEQLASISPIVCRPLSESRNVPITRAILVWPQRLAQVPAHVWLRERIIQSAPAAHDQE
jgi:DNA-binding transcriptional LysR family regulator